MLCCLVAEDVAVACSPAALTTLLVPLPSNLWMLVNAKSLPCARFLIFVVLMLALGFKKAQINTNKHMFNLLNRCLLFCCFFRSSICLVPVTWMQVESSQLRPHFLESQNVNHRQSEIHSDQTSKVGTAIWLVVRIREEGPIDSGWLWLAGCDVVQSWSVCLLQMSGGTALRWYW